MRPLDFRQYWLSRLLVTILVPGTLSLLVLASYYKKATDFSRASKAKVAISNLQPSVFTDAPAAPGDGNWHETPSGLKYLDLAIGQGLSPQPGQKIAYLYSIRLDDGKLVAASRLSLRDNSLEEITCVFGQAPYPAGWTEAVSTMRVGGWRRFILPPKLAYGSQTLGGMIPPESSLMIDIQLLFLDPQILPRSTYQ